MAEDLKAFLDRTKNLRSSMKKRAEVVAFSPYNNSKSHGMDELDQKINTQIINAFSFSHNEKSMGSLHGSMLGNSSRGEMKIKDKTLIPRVAGFKKNNSSTTSLFGDYSPLKLNLDSPKLMTKKNPYLSKINSISKSKKPKRFKLIATQQLPQLKLNKLEKAYA